MKEIKETRTVEELKGYEAFDGTFFRNETECKNYESSAVGVLLQKLDKVKIKDTDLYDLFDGCEETKCMVCVPKEADLDIIKHLYFLSGNSKWEYEDKDIVNNVVILNYNICGNSQGLHDLEYFWIRTLNKIVSYATDGKYELKPVKNGK